MMILLKFTSFFSKVGIVLAMFAGFIIFYRIVTLLNPRLCKLFSIYVHFLQGFRVEKW